MGRGKGRGPRALWLWEDVRIHGQPVDVAILVDREGNAYVAVRLRFLARLNTDLAQRALELADRAIFHLRLSLNGREPRAWVNKALEDPPEDMRPGWDRPLHAEHFEAIGKVRKALKAGCRTIGEIVEYTGLWVTDVISALNYILEENRKDRKA